MSSGRRSQTNQQPKKNLPTKQPLVANMEFETINTPNDLCCVLKGLNAVQKSDIRNMGFESLLSFNIHSVPSGLGHWLLVNYDHQTNELKVGNDIIKVTPSKVHDVFGVPMGKLTVSENKNKRVRRRDVISEDWKNQFLYVTKITVEHVIERLKSYKKGGPVFKVNFLVLFNSILGEMNKDATVNQKFLPSIMNEGDISKFDWCSYVVTCLKRTKEGWNGQEPYNGPLTFLAVLYAHELQLKRSPENAITPAIQYVTTDYLVDLETFMHGKRLFSLPQVRSSNEVQGQTAVDQNVNASQADEDENRVHSTNTGLTDLQTGSRRDENLLNGDDVEVELLEPKLEECELDENASRMSGSLERFSHSQSGLARVKGYIVNRSIAPTFLHILKKHGDFAANCFLKSETVKSSILESLCDLFSRFQTNDVVNMSAAESLLSDAKAVNIDVSWLQAHLDGVRKRKEINKQYCLCLETKAKAVMTIRSARMDLSDRRADLVDAKERFEEVERCLKVMDLVVKKLNDRLFEYEADPVSWVNN